MPGCVNGDSMDLLISMHIISDIVVEEGALVRSTEPPPLTCSPEKRALPTSWTWRLIDSCHCFQSRVGPEEQVGQREDFPGDHCKQWQEPAFFTPFYKGRNSVK